MIRPAWSCFDKKLQKSLIQIVLTKSCPSRNPIDFHSIKGKYMNRVFNLNYCAEKYKYYTAQILELMMELF